MKFGGTQTQDLDICIAQQGKRKNYNFINLAVNACVFYFRLVMVNKVLKSQVGAHVLKIIITGLFVYFGKSQPRRSRTSYLRSATIYLHWTKANRFVRV